MKPFSKFSIFFLLLIIFISSCTTVQVHKSLDSNLIKNNCSPDLLSIIPQEKISIRVVQKDYLGTGSGVDGLLLILADKGINIARVESAKKRVEPLVTATSKFDFKTEYWAALDNALSKLSWLKINNFDKRTAGYNKEEVSKIHAPFMIINAFYELSENADSLIVQTKVNLYISNLNVPDYFGYYTFYSERIGKNKEVDEKAIELWSADSGKLYLDTVRKGIEDNMFMLELDLQKIESTTQNTVIKENELIFYDPLKVDTDAIIDAISSKTSKFNGVILNDNGNRIIFREKGGNLFSISKSSIIKIE
jgi:hypothetical protein